MPTGSTRVRRGSSPHQRERWRAAYAAGDYADKPWFDPDPSPVVARAVEEGFFAPGSAVVDIGCGAGSNVLHLARRGFEAHGVDLAPGAVTAVRARAGREGLVVDVVEGDALNLPYPKGRFEGALDHGCFHTLPASRRVDYANEVARVLRPGGHFLLTWVAREYTGTPGPQHRMAVAEVASALEPRFLFESTSFRPGSSQEGLPAYAARLVRRSARQPPRR